MASGKLQLVARRNRRRLPKPPISRKKRVLPATPRLKKLIKREIAKNIETKEAVAIYDTGTGIKFGGINDATTAGYISTNLADLGIAQGTGASDRIGNEIKVKKNILRITVYAKYQSANPAPMRVHFFLYKNKQTNGALGLAELMNTADSAVDQNGTLIREQYNFNTDLFSIKKHWVRGLTFVPASGSNDINNGYRFDHTMKIDVAKYQPSVWKYDDNDNTRPENANLFLGVWVQSADDTNTGTVSGAVCNIVLSGHLFYTDS